MEIKIPVVRVKNAEIVEDVDLVTEEVPLTVYLNHEEVVTLLCSPEHWDELAVGFLAGQGLLRSREEIDGVEVDARRGLAWVASRVDRPLARKGVFKRMLGSGCGSSISFSFAGDNDVTRPLSCASTLKASAVLALMTQFQRQSDNFRATGGVHSAALATEEEIVVFRDDIGRHNAVDKIGGRCLLEGYPVQDRILLTTGRISSEILTKVARLGTPFLVSRSAPTAMAVNWARELGVTLIGFARGHRFNVYAHAERIILDQ